VIWLAIRGIRTQERRRGEAGSQMKRQASVVNVWFSAGSAPRTSNQARVPSNAAVPFGDKAASIFAIAPQVYDARPKISQPWPM
jgi:hypothetical protein